MTSTTDAFIDTPAAPSAVGRPRRTMVFGARLRVLSTLAEHGGEVRDDSGRVSRTLADLMGASYSAPSSLSQLLRAMERDGLIIRDANGNSKRTYVVRLVDPLPHDLDGRYQQAVDEGKRRAALKAQAATDDVDADADADDEPSLRRLHAAQAARDAVNETSRAYTVDPPAKMVPASAPAPMPEPTADDGINYDTLAAHLLNRVLEAAADAPRAAILAELERARADLTEARQALHAAREDGNRHRTEARELGEELATTKRLLSDARAAVAARDANIERLTTDHHKAVATALSDKARREVERAMTEMPRNGSVA